MKNFARIIDLGEAECCLHRRGDRDLVFDFWLRRGGQILSPTATKTYDVGGLLDYVFDGGYEELLEETCQKVLATVLQQLDLLDEQLVDGVELSLDGETIDKIYRADAD